MKKEEREKRSNAIVEWLLAHELIKFSRLQVLAGWKPDNTSPKYLSGERLLPEEFIPSIEKVLKDYGYNPPA